jgi:hypothetical protein
MDHYDGFCMQDNNEKLKSLKEWDALSPDLKDYLIVMLQDPSVRKLILEEDMNPSQFLAGGWKIIDDLRSGKS